MVQGVKPPFVSVCEVPCMVRRVLVQFCEHEPVSAVDVPLGQRVLLIDLKTSALTGTHAILEWFITSSGRFAFVLLERCSAGQEKMVLPCNLTDPSDEWLESDSSF